MIESTVSKQTLKLLKTALHPSNFDTIDLSNWNEVSKELEMQTVLPLVSDVVEGHLDDDAERIKLFTVVANNIKHFHLLMTIQSRLVELLEKHQIPVAIMKGAAAAQYYPKPELRQMGDIDVLVLPEDFERAYYLLCNAGYQSGEGGLEYVNSRHIPFWTEDGIEIELHRYFSSSKNVRQNDILDKWLYDKLKLSSRVFVGEVHVPVFPILENGLILLGHINQHLTDGLGLRQIIDWYFYVNAELNDIFWENAFKAKAEALGMVKLAMVVTKMCQKYLGLSKDITWCKDTDENLVDALMAYVMRKGNFGRKGDANSYKTISVVHHFFSISGLFSYLTYYGSVHMKEAGLKPIKGIAWLYQIGYLTRKVLSRKGKMKFKEEMKTGVEETVLLKKLEVTRL